MNVFCMVEESLRPIAVLLLGVSDPGSSDEKTIGESDGNVIDSEVGEKLRGGMKLVTVPPSASLVDPDLRKPLAHHEKLSCVAGARYDRGELCNELTCNRDGSAGKKGPGEWDPNYRPVLCVVIVGMDELDAFCESLSLCCHQRTDLDPSPSLVLATSGPSSMHKCGLVVLERVQIEMELQLRDVLA